PALGPLPLHAALPISLGRNYQVTMAAMSAGPLAAGPDGYGILSTVFAAGTVAGGLLAARAGRVRLTQLAALGVGMSVLQGLSGLDRKSTRLNSSHVKI